MTFLSLLFFGIATCVNTAPVSECEVVPITQWAGEASNRATQLLQPVNIVVVQHTVTQDCYNDADCERITKGIRTYQMKHQNFDDIAQSFLIGGNGKVYEGAGWHVGAHTKGFNDKSISISFIGDFRDKEPTPQALQAAQDFLNCAVYKKHLGMNYFLVGHLQLSATLSPGAGLQKIIETWPHWVNDVQQI